MSNVLMFARGKRHTVLTRAIWKEGADQIDPAFPLGIDRRAFKWWTGKGLYHIGHFYLLRGPLTLPHCIANLEMPSPNGLVFFKIANFLRTLQFSTEPSSLTAYEQWCTKDKGSRGGISMAYASLLTSPLQHLYMLAWERDLDFSLEPETWYSTLQVFYKGILNISLIEAGIKAVVLGTYSPGQDVPIYISRLF